MLLVADQMLWLGTQLSHSIINQNQIKAYDIFVNDNPFKYGHDFGIYLDEGLIPFEIEGTFISFKTRSPTDCELKEIPVVLLTDSHWNKADNTACPHENTAEFNNLSAILSLRQEKEDLGSLRSRETDAILGSIRLVYNERQFCQRLMSYIQVASPYHEDVSQRCASVGLRKRHFVVIHEELFWEWNIGLETAKDTLASITQMGVRMAV
eukprot:4406638-Ditylum_brightwellii.AAC.1